MNQNTVAENLFEINERIKVAAQKSGREASDITLVAVSKTVDVDRINSALDNGIINLGESKVQEITEKMTQINKPCKWHQIGHLQTNKVKYIIDKVELIHSLDSISLADELNKRALKHGIKVPVLVEVNISGEDSKYGLFPHDVKDFVKMLSGYDGLKVQGLMTIAPFFENPEQTRPFFSEMNKIYVDIKMENIDNVCMNYLSMGMSNDFEIAIEEGSNMVRIGSAIFGDRPKKVLV